MLQALPKRLRTKVASRFINPTRLVDDLDIRSSDKVLEIGLPIGFFAPALLNKIGDEGTVYVAGPNTDSFGKLSHLAEKKPIKFCLLADVLSGEALPVGEIDMIILTNLLSGTAKPDTFCLAIGQYLKPDSEIVLIDWGSDHKNVGPVMERRVTKEDALKLMHACGMRFKRLLKLPGYHYGMVFGFEPK